MCKTDEWIFEKNIDNSCRYILGIHGLNPLICVGINPSIAEPNHSDPTIRSLKRLAISNGYDGWIMLNLYPKRATNPNELEFEADTEICAANYSFISYIFSKYHPTVVMAAWGTLIKKRGHLKDCLSQIDSIVNSIDCQWVSFGGNTKHGHPHHPLYLSCNAPKNSFNMEYYIRTL